MGVSVTPIASEPLSIKCRICNRSAPRGAKLCEQCKAALRRARQVPTVVTQFLPLAIAGPVSNDRGGGHRKASPVRRQHWIAIPTAPGTWGAYAAIVIFGMAVAVTGYFAVQEIDGDPDRAVVFAVGVHEPVAEPRPTPAAEARETPASRIPAEIAATERDSHASAASALPPAFVAPKPHSRIAVAESKTARPGLTSSATRPQTASGEPEAGQRPSAAAGGSAAMENVAPATIEDAPSVPERWQALNAELARCSRENFFAGLMCDQRTRWQYCEGYWGQVPPCRAANRADGGR